jgi:hypothetical protein
MTFNPLLVEEPAIGAVPNLAGDGPTSCCEIQVRDVETDALLRYETTQMSLPMLFVSFGALR